MGNTDTTRFCNELAARISGTERDLLRRNDPSLVISDHNRTTLLELLELSQRGGADNAGASVSIEDTPADNAGASVSIEDAPVDIAAATNLERSLQDYLREHMSDKPQGHKWIVLASLYLAFVARRPLHPIERTGIVAETHDGRTTYRCPLKAPGDNPICDACICVAE